MQKEIIYDLDLELKNEWEKLSPQEKSILFTYTSKINREMKIDMPLFNQVNEILDKHDITVACVPRV